MAYRDQLVECTQCNKSFVYRVEEQRLQQSMGLPLIPPRTCPECRQETQLESGLRAGVIKRYRSDKHFGFIAQLDGSEIFFHHSGVDESLSDNLVEGAPVWYEVIPTDRGPQAINVHARN